MSIFMYFIFFITGVVVFLIWTDIFFKKTHGYEDLTQFRRICWGVKSMLNFPQTIIHCHYLTDDDNFDITKPVKTYRNYRIFVFTGYYWIRYGGGIDFSLDVYGDGFFIIGLHENKNIPTDNTRYRSSDLIYWMPLYAEKSEDFRQKGILKAISILERAIDNKYDQESATATEKQNRSVMETSTIQSVITNLRGG